MVDPSGRSDSVTLTGVSTLDVASSSTASSTDREKSAPESASPGLTLETLPGDIVVQVCRHLSTRDTFQLAAVSSQTRQAATSDMCWAYRIPPAFVTSEKGPYRMAVEIANSGGLGIPFSEGRTRLLFVEDGDSRPGSLRVEIPPGNRSVAHFVGDNANVDPYDPAVGTGILDSMHWCRHRDINTPGRNTLELKAVCWLDVQSAFTSLPPGNWTFSWHVRFLARALRLELELDFSISTFREDGSAGRTVDFGRPFLDRPDLHRDWLRHDVSFDVLEDETTVVLCLRHTVRSRFCVCLRIKRVSHLTRVCVPSSDVCSPFFFLLCFF